MTDKAYHDKLNLLHEICDGDIALYSIELAIKVCCDLTYQSRVEALILPHEIIVDKSQWEALPPSELRERFKNLGHINDLEKVIAMQRKALISTPLNSANRPLMLSSLGFSYQCRYEQFGDVNDIDSAIRQQSKAVASLSCDSTHRPAILTNFGNAYMCRFERLGERKDIDFAIDHMLEAVTKVQLVAPTELDASAT